jgi:hypothetical protein
MFLGFDPQLFHAAGCSHHDVHRGNNNAALMMGREQPLRGCL